MNPSTANRQKDILMHRISAHTWTIELWTWLGYSSNYNVARCLVQHTEKQKLQV